MKPIATDRDAPDGIATAPTDTSTLWQAYFHTALGALISSGAFGGVRLVVEEAAAWADAAVAEVDRREALVVGRRAV